MVTESKICNSVVIGLLALMVFICCIPFTSAETVTQVTTPFITIDPIGNHTVGDMFFINGTTNLPDSDNLLMWITSSDYERPHDKSEMGPLPGEYTDVQNISIFSDITGTNRWSVNVTNTVKELDPGEFNVYLVSIPFSIVPCHAFNCACYCNATGCLYTSCFIKSTIFLFISRKFNCYYNLSH